MHLRTNTRPSRFGSLLPVIAALSGVACSTDAAPTAPGLSPSAAVADRGTPTYTFTSINVPGAASTSVQGINADGVISGLYIAAGHAHGFILQEGVFTTIHYPGADNTEVRGIGPDGSVVGDHWNGNEEAVAAHGFKRTADGQFTTVHYPGHLYEFPQRLLPDGTILGCRHDHDLMSSMKGALIGRGGASETDAFASMYNGATPDGSRIVGMFTDQASGLTKAFIIDDGGFSPFMVPGSNLTTAWDINPRGDIVGVYRNSLGVHGYVLTGDGYTTLNMPGAAATRAFGINARGDVVGAYVAGGVTHGFVAVRR